MVTRAPPVLVFLCLVALDSGFEGGIKTWGGVLKLYNLCRILFPSYILSLLRGYTFQLQVEKKEGGCSRSYS